MEPWLAIWAGLGATEGTQMSPETPSSEPMERICCNLLIFSYYFSPYTYAQNNQKLSQHGGSELQGCALPCLRERGGGERGTDERREQIEYIPRLWTPPLFMGDIPNEFRLVWKVFIQGGNLFLVHHLPLPLVHVPKFSYVFKSPNFLLILRIDVRGQQTANTLPQSPGHPC